MTPTPSQTHLHPEIRVKWLPIGSQGWAQGVRKGKGWQGKEGLRGHGGAGEVGPGG